MTRQQAEQIAGTLSTPSKMPCHGYSIPAARCKTGGKMRKVAGSTCSKCYAFKGNYPFPNVQRAMDKRFKSLGHKLWVEAMVTMIEAIGESYFRWHDSGDVQSVKHLANIARVCELTPNVRHWLPCREYKIVMDWMKQGGTIPRNLVIRLSAHMVNAMPSDYGLPTSTVHSGSMAQGQGPFKIINSIPTGSHVCPSRQQGNKCGELTGKICGCGTCFCCAAFTVAKEKGWL